MKTAPLTLALLCALTIGTTACQPHDSGTAPSTASTSAERSNIDKAMEKAHEKLEHGNISVSHGAGKADAEISPTGDLLIDGKAVALTPAQRKLVLDYRGRVVEVASAGIDIGAQGANLAVHAMGEALKGVLHGDTDHIEERVNAQADGIRQAALKLCDRLPAMRDSQMKLAAAVPEFAPYATMTEDDIEDCRKDAVEQGTTSKHSAPAAPAPPAPPEPPAPPAPKK